MRTVFSMCTLNSGTITEVLCTVAESSEEAAENFRQAEPRVIPHGCFVTANKEIACVCHVFSVFPTTTDFPIAYEDSGHLLAFPKPAGAVSQSDLRHRNEELGAGGDVLCSSGPQLVRPVVEDRGSNSVPQIPPPETVTPPTFQTQAPEA